MDRKLVRWDGLRRSLAGRVILPGSDEYRTARRGRIPGYDAIQPEVIIRCLTPDDVSEALLFARLHGFEVRARSGGHSFLGRSTTTGMVIDVSEMSEVTMDGDRATVGPGTTLGELYSALAAHHRTLPAGCGDDVGIAGLTLGGGVGILGRLYGLTSDRLTGAQVATGDGGLMTCSSERHEDLFWALRGAGGGQFGVVTSFEFETVPAPRATAFHLTWAGASLARVVHQWQNWAPDAPREMSASLLVRVDGADGDELSARPMATVFGAMIGSADDAYPLLSDFVKQAGSEPESADLQELPHREAKRYLNSLFAEHSVVRHHLYTSEFHDRPMSLDTTQTLLARFSSGLTPGQQRELDFTPWGGAYNDPAEGDTAFAHRSQRFMLKQAVNLVLAPRHEELQATRAWLDRSSALTRVTGSGRVYPNFPQLGLDGWEKAYHGSNYERLTQVKAAYDPGNVFQFDQSIPPA